MPEIKAIVLRRCKSRTNGLLVGAIKETNLLVLLHFVGSSPGHVRAYVFVLFGLYIYAFVYALKIMGVSVYMIYKAN